MTTIKDVAQRAGVSPSTVSIVLNDHACKRKISVKTCEKVHDAARELNYRPNISARKLRGERESKPVIAVYWPLDLRINHMIRFLNGFQQEVTRINLDCEIVIHTYKNDRLSEDKGLSQMSVCHAAIIASASPRDIAYLEENLFPMPIILFNRNSTRHFSVSVDNYKMGEAASQLFAERKHRNAAVIFGNSSYFAMNIRYEGFRAACLKNGIRIEEQHTFYTDYSIEGGVAAAQKFLSLNCRPRALFCNSDIVALGVLSAFQAVGLNVPEDVEVIAIGMSSMEYTLYSTPPLTVVDVPMEAMAVKCVAMIDNALKRKPNEPRNVSFDAPLIIRESCPAPPGLNSP